MSQFKVIIAGGGPVGLTAALALSKANIEFTLLEKYETVVPTQGSDLVISPIGLRALSQLGIFEELQRISTPLGPFERLDHQGNSLGRMDIFDKMKENFGQAAMVLKRYDICKALYDAIPHHDNVMCHKDIVTVNETADGVTVTCADGSSYSADMIIGADGVHSVVRAHMDAAAAAPLQTEFRCLWMRLDTVQGLKAGHTYEIHGPGASSQVFISEEHVVCAIYERLPQPIFERVRYTEKDEKEMIERWKYLPILPDRSITMADLWAARTQTGITPLQEGVREQWSSAGGRSVLVGDAAHVYSPITGAGCNNGIIDVAVVCNELRRLLDAAAPSVSLSSESLAKAFTTYQEVRKPQVDKGNKLSVQLGHLTSWDGIINRLMDQYVMRLWFMKQFGINMAMEEMAKTPCFDFLPEDKRVVGKIPWLKSGKADGVAV